MSKAMDKQLESYLFETRYTLLFTTCSLCNFNMALNFATSILRFALQGDNDLTEERRQSCEPNKLVTVKVRAAVIFLARSSCLIFCHVCS